MAQPSLQEFDVIILGAGPAGVSAGLKLAALGRRTALVSASQPQNHSRLETVPNLAVLRHVLPDIVTSGPALIDPARSGISWWNGQETITDPVAVLDRNILDAALPSLAQHAGVTVFSTEKNLLQTSKDSAWHINFSSTHIHAPFLIDATDRHSRLRKREALVPWKQIGITGEITFAHHAPGLWTESLPDGWLWAIRGASNQGMATIFADPSSLTEGSSSLSQRLLSQSRLAGQFTASLTSLKTIETTPAAAAHVFENAILHTGDAALARDPLSSQGLTAALSDGQSAAIAIHTLLADPARQSIVREFLEDRNHQAKLRHRAFLTESCADAPYDTPFWSIRRQGHSKAAPLASPAPPPPDCPLTLSPQWTMRSHPVLEDDAIRLAPCLCALGFEPVRWLAGRPIELFLPPPAKTETARALLHRWITSQLVTEQTAWQILQWLTTRQILEPAVVSCVKGGDSG